MFTPFHSVWDRQIQYDLEKSHWRIVFVKGTLQKPMQLPGLLPLSWAKNNLKGQQKLCMYTLGKYDMEPKNGGLEDDSPFALVYL